MKLPAFLFFLFLCLTAATGFSQNLDSLFGVYYKTWNADPPEIQLRKEGTLIPLKLGAIFIPQMSVSTLEPRYYIYRLEEKGKKLLYDNAEVNRTYLVEPGEYLIRTGTGELKLTEKVTVKEREYSIIEPFWGGMSFKVQDENHNFIKQNFDVFQISEDERPKLLTFSSEDFDNIDKIRTYYLPPGIYKIVKSGSSVNTQNEFFTVTVLPGRYIPYMIVMNSENFTLTGSGLIDREYQQTKINNWRLYSALHGNFNLNHSKDASTNEYSTIYTLSGQYEFNAKYDNKRQYFSTRNSVEEGWNKKNSENFESYADNIETKNIYVFKFIKNLGIYTRFNLSSSFFPTHEYLDDEDTLYLGTTDNPITGGDREKVRLTPSFYPVSLKEGVGINLTFTPSNRFTLYLRSGLGFKQNYNRNVYIKSETNGKLFLPMDDYSIKGIEGNIYSQVILSSDITLTSEFDILSPFKSQSELAYDFENIINIRLLGNISLDYTFSISQDKNINDVVYTENIVLLRFSYFFF